MSKPGGTGSRPISARCSPDCERARTTRTSEVISISMSGSRTSSSSSIGTIQQSARRPKVQRAGSSRVEGSSRRRTSCRRRRRSISRSRAPTKPASMNRTPPTTRLTSTTWGVRLSYSSLSLQLLRVTLTPKPHLRQELIFLLIATRPHPTPSHGPRVHVKTSSPICSSHSPADVPSSWETWVKLLR
jgi:hypothetical protein